MKRLAILLLAGVGLAGCVAVAEPYPPAGVYAAPSAAVVVRPYGYYGYYGGPRYYRHGYYGRGYYGHRYP